MLFQKRIPTVIAALVLSCGAVSQAAPVAWSNANGSSTNFSWSNGANDQGAAGDPLTVNGKFAFFPNLKAFTISSAPSSAGEIIHVTLTPIAGMRISSISASFFGDATVLGTGAAGYSATLDAQKHGSSTHVSSTLMPADTTTQSTFNDNLALNVPDSFGKVDLTLNTSLHAMADRGSSAFVEMKVLQFSVGTSPAMAVPLPAAVATFPIGAAVAAFASKRMKKRA